MQTSIAEFQEYYAIILEPKSGNVFRKVQLADA